MTRGKLLVAVAWLASLLVVGGWAQKTRQAPEFQAGHPIGATIAGANGSTQLGSESLGKDSLGSDSLATNALVEASLGSDFLGSDSLVEDRSGKTRSPLVIQSDAITTSASRRPASTDAATRACRTASRFTRRD
jgi:hypothetical protein